MNIELSSQHQKWLEEQVAAGHFASIEEAVSVAISDLRTASEDDFAWTKPYVDKARQSVAAGNFVSGEDFLAELDAKIASFRTS